jgi:hypothetical protein
MKNSKAFSLIEVSLSILVISILIIGVIKGSILINSMRLASAKSITKSSIVNNMKGLYIWLETSLDSDFDSLSDGAAISSWVSKNPQVTASSVTLSQETSSYRPTFVNDGIGGVPSINFDGSDDYLSSIENISFPSSYSIFAVYKQRIGGSPEDIFSAYYGSAHGIVLEINSSSGGIRSLHRSPVGSSGGDNNISSGTLAAGKAGIVSIIRDRNNADLDIRINGTDASPSSPDVTENEFSSLSIAIGSIGYSNIRAFDGQISEIIIFDRDLKSQEVEDVENYLSQKYSIKLR